MRDKRFLHFAVLAFLWLTALVRISHASNEVPQVPQVTLVLKDGSRLIGLSSLATVSISTGAVSVVTIPLDQVREIKFGTAHTNVIVRLVNGSQIKAVLNLLSVQLNTSFGLVTVPTRLVDACHVRLVVSQNVSNSALQFDGSQNYVSVPAFNNTTTDKTVEFWAKSSGNGGGFYAGSWSGPFEWLFINNTLVNQFYLETATGTVYVDPVPSEAGDGAWHHYALVEQSGTATIYIDGINRASGTASLSQTGGFTIGTVGAAVGNTAIGLHTYPGTIDEFRISNIATHTGQFDPCDPANFVNSGHTVALWHLNEGTGNTAADSSGNGHTGTLLGAPLPTWVGGFECSGSIP